MLNLFLHSARHLTSLPQPSQIQQPLLSFLNLYYTSTTQPPAHEFILPDQATKMAKETVHWNDVETWKRLVASIVATVVKVSLSSCTFYSQLTGIVQIDLSETAKHFGTTYSTLENRFRPIKKDAAAMQGDKTGNDGETTPRTKAGPATPRSKTPKDVLHSMSACLRNRNPANFEQPWPTGVLRRELQRRSLMSSRSRRTTMSPKRVGLTRWRARPEGDARYVRRRIEADYLCVYSSIGIERMSRQTAVSTMLGLDHGVRVGSE